MSDIRKPIKWDNISPNTWECWINYVMTRTGHVYRSNPTRSLSMSNVQAALINKNGQKAPDGSKVVYRIRIRKIISRNPNTKWYLPRVV